MLGSRSTPELELEFDFESSHEQNHPKSTLLSLPHEILELIIAYASLRGLKSLRSACKLFSTFTDPALFHTVIIVPCPTSLDLITTLPHHERISRHVKSLIYDDRWPDLSRSIRNNLPRANIGSVSQIAQARLFLTLDHLTQLTRCFKENPSNEVAHFKQVLDRLPSLRGVSIFSTHKHDKSAKLPRFYSSICSDILCEIIETNLLPQQPQRSERAQSALLAISQSSVHVTELYMNGLSWRQMSHSQAQESFFTRPVFATVRCLELRFGHTQYDPLFCGKTLLARLGHALSQAIHLEILRLDFGDETAQDNVDEAEESVDRPWCMLSALFNSEHRSHNLRELDFQNLRFSEAGFITFLDHHASTMKSLRLNSVELVAAPGSRSPCWRRVFIHIQSVLGLHQVQLQDGLYISGGGVWISMHPRPEERFPGCLLDQVEQFILHGGECPIRAGYHDLKQNDLNGLGDESWAFY